MALFSGNMNMLVPVFTSLFSVFFALVLYMFGKQPRPYMDEVFHIPQVQKYCEHRFNEWDPMITTLPGLYFCTWLFVEGLALALKQDVKVICMPLFLRIINVVFNMGNIWVVYRILGKLNEMKIARSKKKTDKTPTSQDNNASYSGNDNFYHSSTALTLGIFPLSFFFMFLYYTDNGSTFFVLLMYYLSLNDRHLCAAIVGIYAIFFRQTNIVWVVFTVGVSVVRMLEPAVFNQLRGDCNLSLIREFIRQIFYQVKSLVRTLWPYAFVMLFFGAFVFLNGGVAIGDKTHHKVCFNFPQIFYFACFTAFFSVSHLTCPRVLYGVYTLVATIVRRRWYHSLIILLIFIVYYLIQNHTHVHPYLLADNRHYPFYVWKNVYKAYPEMKMALIPVYLAALAAMFVALDQTCLWKIVYAVCVSAVLIPQGLLEFRYFILPYLMFRVHMRRPETWKLASEFLLYATVNFFTIWVFLKKTFHWPNSSDVQRFMW